MVDPAKNRRPQRGRPRGGFTQHRRVAQLRDLLERRPQGLTLSEMAEKLGVSARTMRRYLNEIKRDYDLEGKPVRGGGPRLWSVPGKELPRKVELRRTQIYALLAARRLFEPMRGSTLYEEVSFATEKLSALAQRPGRGPNAGLADARLEERFLYLPHAPTDYSGHTDALDDLFQAVSDLRPLSLRYEGGSRADGARILIHPYAMVLHRDAIYCLGLFVEKNEVRTYRLDRMRDTQCLYAEVFALPKDFDVELYFQGEFGIWRSEERHRVIVEFDAQAAPYVRSRRVHRTQKLTALPGGGLRLSMQIGDLTPVTSWVLEWGPRARVVEPPALVAMVRSQLKEAAAQYAAPRRAKR
jgi:predicted DNA-binding transcriptional regulator YafY